MSPGFSYSYNAYSSSTVDSTMNILCMTNLKQLIKKYILQLWPEVANSSSLPLDCHKLGSSNSDMLKMKTKQLVKKISVISIIWRSTSPHKRGYDGKLHESLNLQGQWKSRMAFINWDGFSHPLLVELFSDTIQKFLQNFCKEIIHDKLLSVYSTMFFWFLKCTPALLRIKNKLKLSQSFLKWKRTKETLL